MSSVADYKADGVDRRDRTGRRIPDQNVWHGEVQPWPLEFHADGPYSVRLAYAGGAHDDDWEHGVLWLRHGMDRSGRHQWAAVNTPRTRAMMARHLCLVCSEPAVDPETGRIRWLLTKDPDLAEDGTPITNVPPTCLNCTPEALASCPRLRHTPRLVSVTGSRMYAITADIYAPAADDVLPVRAELAFRGVDIVLSGRNAAVLPYALALQPWVALDDMRDEPLRRSCG